MSPYVYRGNKRAEDQRPRNLGTFNPSACGTYAGWKRHRKSGIPACGPCQDANKAYRAAWYRAHNPIKERAPFNPDKCGTPAGYKRHKRYGNDVCEPCGVAKQEYQSQWRARQAQARKAA